MSINISTHQSVNHRLLTRRPAPVALFSIPAYARIENPVIDTSGTSDFGEGFAVIIANLWQSMVTVGAILFIFYFAWGALGWLTAGGDKAKLEEARQRIANALIGLVILAASVALIEFLGGLLNLPFLEDLSFIFPEA